MYKWADTCLFFLHSFLTWQVTLTNYMTSNTDKFPSRRTKSVCIPTSCVWEDLFPHSLAWWVVVAYLFFTNLRNDKCYVNIVSIYIFLILKWVSTFFSCLRVIFIPLCESLSVQFFSQFYYQVFNPLTILYSRNIINLLSMICAVNIFFQSFDWCFLPSNFFHT